MRKNQAWAIAGIVAGTAGVIALGFLLKKFVSNKKVEKFEDELVARILENSQISRDAKKPKKVKVTKKSRKSVAKMKASSLIVMKNGNASKLLSSMKKGEGYTQIQLVEKSGIPYRSVRRYVEYLHKQGKVRMSGYGKGKKFARA